MSEQLRPTQEYQSENPYIPLINQMYNEHSSVAVQRTEVDAQGRHIIEADWNISKVEPTKITVSKITPDGQNKLLKELSIDQLVNTQFLFYTRLMSAINANTPNYAKYYNKNFDKLWNEYTQKLGFSQSYKDLVTAKIRETYGS